MRHFLGFVFCLVLVTIGAAQQTSQPLKPSYLPAIGRTFAYRLLVNGEIQAETSGVVGFAHFAVTVDIDQKWQKIGDKLRCELTVKGGTLRVFSSAGEQTHKLGWVQLTFITTPNGEVVDIMGGGARSLDELVANFDLMATALAALVVPFPKEGVQLGDAWQGVHQLGTTITLATVQCVEQPNLFPRLQPIKLRLRYLLPIDALVDPILRSQWNFTARYTAESEVIFSIVEGRTISASGTIKLEVGMKFPIQQMSQEPAQKQEQNQPGSEQGREGKPEQREQQQSGEQNQQSSPIQLPTPAFQLKVDAKFELVKVQ